MSDFILNSDDLANVITMTGVKESDLSDAFLDAFEYRLHLQHRLQPGPLAIPLLVQLCIDHGMLGQAGDKRPAQVRWDAIQEGAPVLYRQTGKGAAKKGVFKHVIAGGKIAIAPARGKQVLELSPHQVTLSRERPVPEREPTPAREESAPTVPWHRMAQGTPVRYRGKKGFLVALRQPVDGSKEPPKLTIEINGNEVDVPQHEATLFVRPAKEAG